ncbi:transposase [Streptomyces avermitilis]|uniref:transposase n=1 Tax=Streptomyces avermitilis TaxID=33903 RepID=UPI0038259FB5
MVERLVPDGLWELFQRVVPDAPVRPRGGGRRRYGDRQVLAAILFVATTGCTWRQLPSVRSDRAPAVHRVEPGSGLGQAPPHGAGRTWCARRVGLGAVRDRLGEHAGGEGGS